MDTELFIKLTDDYPGANSSHRRPNFADAVIWSTVTWVGPSSLTATESRPSRQCGKFHSSDKGENSNPILCHHIRYIAFVIGSPGNYATLAANYQRVSKVFAKFFVFLNSTLLKIKKYEASR